jgi:hypothetical protein
LTLQERRRFPRHLAPEDLTAVARFPGGREQMVRVLNISIDGVCFVTDFDISRESVFNLSLTLTVGRGPVAHVDTPAKIAWYTFEVQSSLYTAGVQFLGLGDAQMETLHDALSFLPQK